MNLFDLGEAISFCSPLSRNFKIAITLPSKCLTGLSIPKIKTPLIGVDTLKLPIGLPWLSLNVFPFGRGEPTGSVMQTLTNLPNIIVNLTKIRKSSIHYIPFVSYFQYITLFFLDKFTCFLLKHSFTYSKNKI